MVVVAGMSKEDSSTSEWDSGSREETGDRSSIPLAASTNSKLQSRTTMPRRNNHRQQQQPLEDVASDLYTIPEYNHNSVVYSAATTDNMSMLTDDRTVVASNATSTLALASSWQHQHPSDQRLGRQEAPGILEEEADECDSSGDGTTTNKHSASLKNGKVAPFVTTLPGIDEKGVSDTAGRRIRKKKIDWSLLGIVAAVLLILLAVIVGSVLGTQNRKDNDSAATTNNSNSIYANGTFAPMYQEDDDMMIPGTDVPSDADADASPTDFPEIITTFPPEQQQPPCTRVIKSIPNNTVVFLVLEVLGDISPGEVEYASVVFQKVFNSFAATCDSSSCRHVAAYSIAWDRLNSNSTILSSTCDAVLELQLQVEGSYLGCAEQQGNSDFIGLFFENGAAGIENDGTRHRRNMLRQRKHNNPERLLQQDSFGQCITSLTLGNVAGECAAESRSAAVVDMMNEMATTTIPSVCRLESVQDGSL